MIQMEGTKEYKNQENYSQANGADLKAVHHPPLILSKKDKKKADMNKFIPAHNILDTRDSSFHSLLQYQSLQSIQQVRG